MAWPASMYSYILLRKGQFQGITIARKRGGFHIISGNTCAVFADIQYLILTYSNELDTT
jgi:hypothetical protein